MQTQRPGSPTRGPTGMGLQAPGSRGEGPRGGMETETTCAQQTYIGSILVSVNPYRMFGIYGQEQVQQYSGRALGENPP